MIKKYIEMDNKFLAFKSQPIIASKNKDDYFKKPMKHPQLEQSCTLYFNLLYIY